VDPSGLGVAFPDFCKQLSALGYDQDVSALWGSLAAAADTAALASLSWVDPKSARRLEAVADWCKDSAGGILEVFLAFGPACGSISHAQLEEGMRSLGFTDNITEVLPLLDPWWRGAICVQDFFLLEQDPAKRRLLDRQWRAAAKSRSITESEPVAHEAAHFLFGLAKEATPLGGKHWKAFQNKVPIGKPKGPAKAASMPRLRRSEQDSNEGRGGHGSPLPLQAPEPLAPVPEHGGKGVKGAEDSRTTLPELSSSCTSTLKKHKKQTRSLYQQSQFQSHHRSGFLPALKSAKAVVPHWGQTGQTQPTRQPYTVMPFGKDQALFEQFERKALE